MVLVAHERSGTWAIVAAILALLLLGAGGAWADPEPPILDLTGCEPAGDVEATEDRNTLIVLWRCPDGSAWRMLYRAQSVRSVILAKPAPSPTPGRTP